MTPEEFALLDARAAELEAKDKEILRLREVLGLERELRNRGIERYRGALQKGVGATTATESLPEGSSVDPATLQQQLAAKTEECERLRDENRCDYERKRKLEAEVRELKDLNIQGNRLGSWLAMKQRIAQLESELEKAREGK